MKFRTELTVEPSAPLTHADLLLMLGSCFTDEVGARLQADGFRAEVNPSGTLYNPLSVARTVEMLECGREYVAEDFFENQGLWRSFDHHSSLASADLSAAVARVNAAMNRGADALREASCVIVTFGTAWVFTLPDGTVVCNCHKLPAARFVRRRLSVDEIVDAWRPILRRYADRRFIFTISPIRHIADGLHGNQLSKATLLLAVDRLCEEFGAEYFPAYEALMDDLRDYRFYAADMKHPSDIAVDYVYDLFAAAHFSADTLREALACRKAHRASMHRARSAE
ncbi:MAG: GSCFA domain-containing protein [Muribaculaceae bacterium]|nr:GSCFA domain-containing protein [Muribaculaceae bacterium]